MTSLRSEPRRDETVCCACCTYSIPGVCACVYRHTIHAKRALFASACSIGGNTRSSRANALATPNERERERERECSVSADEKDAFSRGEQRKSRLYRANGVVDIEPGVALLKRVDVSSSMNEDDHRTLSAVIGEFDVIRCRGTQFTPRNSTNRRRGR